MSKRNKTDTSVSAAVIKSEENYDDNDDDNDISSYEKIRLANIQRNEEFLSAIGISNNTVSSLSASSSSSSAAANKKKRSQSSISRNVKVQLPTRRSGRVTLEKVKSELENAIKTNEDASVIELKRKEYDEMISKGDSINTYNYEEASSYAVLKRITDDIAIGKPLNITVDDDSDVKGEDVDISSVIISNNKNNKKSSPASSSFSVASIKSLKIHNNEVSKVTESRITSVYLHPMSSKIICCAGDKSGYVGIWDVKNDGVFKYQPHVSNVTQLYSSINNDHNTLLSSSYDGTVKTFDFNKDIITTSFVAPEGMDDIYFSDVSFLDNNSMYLGRSDSKIGFIDLRTYSNKYAWLYNTNSNKINSIQINPINSNELIIASSSMTGYISIYDIRKIATTTKAVIPLIKLTDHTKSINAACMTPNGQFLVSICQDNTIRIWNAANGYKDCQVTSHDNHTGRWLSTFRPAFDLKNPSIFMTGSMERNRCIEVYELSTVGTSNKVSNKLVTSLRSEILASVCSRNAFHPTLNVIAGGNSSGRVHIFS